MLLNWLVADLSIINDLYLKLLGGVGASISDDSASASQSAAARGSLYLLLTACLQLTES